MLNKKSHTKRSSILVIVSGIITEMPVHVDGITDAPKVTPIYMEFGLSEARELHEFLGRLLAKKNRGDKIIFGVDGFIKL